MDLYNKNGIHHTAQVHHNAVIRNSKVGPFTVIGENVIINDSEIGAYCHIGFPGGVKEPKDGKVRINRCRVLNYAAIHSSDTFETLLIESLIMDFVNIGHDCRINNSVIATGCRIAGYCKVEDSRLGMNTVVRNRMKVFSAQIGAGSVVVSSILSGKWAGHPAKPLK